MRGTIALPLQARIIALRFVDCRTVEVRQPSLDPPCRHDHQDPFFRESDRYSCLVARIRKLSHACGNRVIPSRFLEKLADEGLVLLVFTQHNELDSPAQRSQPLATNSESFRPTFLSFRTPGGACGRPTVMTPEVSRCNIMPFS
jgi:hypothetical protein